jgi:hypothetical protein
MPWPPPSPTRTPLHAQRRLLTDCAAREIADHADLVYRETSIMGGFMQKVGSQILITIQVRGSYVNKYCKLLGGFMQTIGSRLWSIL